MTPFLVALLAAHAWAADPEPTPEAPPTPVADPTPTGAQVLDDAIARLTAGKYDEALAIAITAESKYPELAVSFQSIASIAVEQLERKRAPAPPPPLTTSYPTWATPRGTSGMALPTPRPYGTSGVRSPPRHTTRATLGFEIGAPTGFRAEIDLGATHNGTVTAIGLRVGGNGLTYQGEWPVADVTMYLDFRASEKWRIEGLVGGFSYFGWAYPETGVALRYDPKGPLLATFGGRVGPYGSWLPDASVGFLW